MSRVKGKIHQPRPVPTPDAAALSSYLASLRRLLADGREREAQYRQAAETAKHNLDLQVDIVATWDYRVREAERLLGVPHVEVPPPATGWIQTWVKS